MEEYIFTFGCGQELEGFCVRVKGTDYSDCRQKMIEKFGIEWAFQYPINKWNEWITEASRIGMPVEEEIMVIE